MIYIYRCTIAILSLPLACLTGSGLHNKLAHRQRTSWLSVGEQDGQVPTDLAIILRFREQMRLNVFDTYVFTFWRAVRFADDCLVD